MSADRADKFEKAVDKRIKFVQNRKADPTKRAGIALWLGECGDPRAIEALVRVYENQSDDAKVRKAAAYALGQYKALAQEVGTPDGVGVEAALVANRDVSRRLIDIAEKGKLGKRKSSAVLWGVFAFLLVTFGGLAVFNVMLMNADEDEPAVIIEAPTDEPTPTEAPVLIDGQTATPEPTATPTLTPTPTIAPEDYAPYVREMTNILDTLTRPRGPVELLRQNWLDAQQFGQTDGCRDPFPNLPSNVIIPPQYLNEVAGLREAQLQVGIVLDLLNSGWERFFESCAAGNLQQQAEFIGLSIIGTIDTTIDTLREPLRDLQRRVQ